MDWGDVFSSISMGLIHSESATSGDELVHRGQGTLRYSMKGAHTQVYDPCIERQLRRQLHLEAALVHAIDRREFRLYLQPVFELNTEQVVGFEALIRWKRADGEGISPGEFIPLAEASGLIHNITRWVLDVGFSVARDLKVLAPELFLSINLSAQDLNRSELLQEVDAVLAASKVDPRSIKLEVTETAFIKDPKTAAKILTQLRDRGLGLALDDFGVGWSSLHHLLLPFDTLKIDRSFVLSMADGTDLVAATVGLARVLDLTVIAEGIENQAQAAALRKLGCRYGQGYLFARPMPVSEAFELISQDGADVPF